MTNLDDEIHAVFNDNLRDLAGWFVQDDTEVVLCEDRYSVQQHERQAYLGEDTVGWV